MMSFKIKKKKNYNNNNIYADVQQDSTDNMIRTLKIKKKKNSQ